MKVKIEHRNVVAGNEHLSCEAWSQDGHWASEPRKVIRPIFYRKHPKWRFNFPSSLDISAQEAFFHNCEHLDIIPNKPLCFYMDNYTYKLGFILP